MFFCRQQEASWSSLLTDNRNSWQSIQ